MDAIVNEMSKKFNVSDGVSDGWVRDSNAALMFILRSTNSSHSIYNNARFFKRYTLHSTSVSRLHASPFQKFHVTDLFSATHRDAMRRTPRRHWQPVGPFQRFRQRFDNIPSNYLLFGILGINGAVFAAWSYVQLFQVRPHSPLHRRS